MRHLRILLPFFLTSITAFGQNENPISDYKYDISLLYGADLYHFGYKTPSIELRRSISENWKLKLTLMGNRDFLKFETIKNRTFALSDTAEMNRNEKLYYGLGRTIQIGADYTKLEHFTIGAQLIYGKGTGYVIVTDRAFIQLDEDEYTGWSGYSEELTQAYHPMVLNSSVGTAHSGSWQGRTLTTDYQVVGLGLTLEAKWPIRKHFEAALQYRPEFQYFMFKEKKVTYETDEYITTEFSDLTSFNQYAQLLFRYKF